MNDGAFDTLAAAKALAQTGFEERRAEAVTGVARRATPLRGCRLADRDTLATKTDLAALEPFRVRGAGSTPGGTAGRAPAPGDASRAIFLATGVRML